jgi:hypothetical protein
VGPFVRPQVARRYGQALGGQPVAVPPDVGMVPVQPSQPGALGPQLGTYIRLPGANFPPAGATPVDEMGDADVAAGGSATILSIAIPNGQTFRMAGIGFTAEDETALAFLSWTIMAPDPAIGYIAKSAAIGSVRNLTEIFFLQGSSVTVSIVASTTAAAVVTYHYFARVRGWFFSEKEQ